VLFGQKSSELGLKNNASESGSAKERALRRTSEGQSGVESFGSVAHRLYVGREVEAAAIMATTRQLDQAWWPAKV